MKPVFVNSAVCISAQNTLAEDVFAELKLPERTNLLNAIEPSYKEFITPGLIRRMSKVVKMSSVAAQKSLQEAEVENPDAIIVGTGMGCSEDSEKFLKNLIENGEEFLTPTYFIQSTHNTVAGQIALSIPCHSYNFTYVNCGSSFEFSLLDAKLQLENGEAQNCLVGGTDVIADHTEELYELNKTIKAKNEIPENLLDSKTEGVVWGNGSAFFVLENEKSESSYSQLVDISIVNILEKSEIKNFINDFLTKNNLENSEIDAVIFGFSGDHDSDNFYREAQQLFENSAQLYFKHLCGEFNTAAAFAFFMANQILKKQEIPELIKINNFEKKEIRNILIYNNFFEKEHSLVLLKKP